MMNFKTNSLVNFTVNFFGMGKSLREKSPYLELFWPTFSCNRNEYGETQRYLMQENTDQNNSKYGLFLRSEYLHICISTLKSLAPRNKKYSCRNKILTHSFPMQKAWRKGAFGTNVFSNNFQ